MPGETKKSCVVAGAGMAAQHLWVSPVPKIRNTCAGMQRGTRNTSKCDLVTEPQICWVLAEVQISRPGLDKPSVLTPAWVPWLHGYSPSGTWRSILFSASGKPVSVMASHRFAKGFAQCNGLQERRTRSDDPRQPCVFWWFSIEARAQTSGLLAFTYKWNSYKGILPKQVSGICYTHHSHQVSPCWRASGVLYFCSVTCWVGEVAVLFNSNLKGWQRLVNVWEHWKYEPSLVSVISWLHWGRSFIPPGFPFSCDLATCWGWTSPPCLWARILR